MKLENKKSLVARALGVGKKRVKFNVERLSELEKAITKQDINDLLNSGAIFIKEKKGRKKAQKSKSRRRAGSIRKKPKKTKRQYVIITRKLRAYLKALKQKGKISQEDFEQFRKEIRARSFKSLSHLKETISNYKEKAK